MDYRRIESPSNANLELNLYYVIVNELTKRRARWPKERVHGDEKLTIYFTWPRFVLSTN